MSEMIERAANAIRRRYAEVNYMDPIMDVDPVELARAAIEAMCEPTEAMKLAPPDVNFGPMDAEHCWQAMIDAALEQP